MNKDLGNLFLYLSGLTALGFGIVGLLATFGQAVLKGCCNTDLITGDSVLYALAGQIWYPILWAGLGIGILMLTVRARK